MANRADFAPELGALKSLRPFVFWAQTTLPTVFDDSLSYYEVLTKLTKMVNTMLENEDTNAENIAALAEAYQELEDFTNNYFDNLDVTQEINDKLDKLVADGTIGGYVVERATTLVNNYLYGEDGESGVNKDIKDLISDANADIQNALDGFATRSNLAVTTFETNSAASIRTFENRVDSEIGGISTIVKDWMDDNFTNPSSVVIDDTLTVKNAAAEAYATGKLMDATENMVLATAYWQNYVIDSISGSFILADTAGGSNPAVGTGAPSMTLYVANVTPGETYLVSGVASSYSTQRYIPAYALGNLTYDASDNPHYEFYDVYPRGWVESQDPGTVYQYVRNQTVRIPTGTTPTVTHLFIMGDSRVPITVRCSRLNVRTDDTLTSQSLPAQGKATGDAIAKKIPWPLDSDSPDFGQNDYILASDGAGGTKWKESAGVVGIVAYAFSESNDYESGSYVIYNGKLYRFVVDHERGAFTAGDCVEITVCDDLQEIRDALMQEPVAFDMNTFGTDAYPTGFRNGRWNTSGLSKATNLYVRSNKSFTPEMLADCSAIVINSEYKIQWYSSDSGFPYAESGPVSDFKYGGDYAAGPVTIPVEPNRYYNFSLNVHYSAETISDIASATSVTLVKSGSDVESINNRIEELENNSIKIVQSYNSNLSNTPNYKIPYKFVNNEKLITDSETSASVLYNRIQGICSDGNRYLYYCLLSAGGRGIPCKFDTWTNKRVLINTSLDHDYGHCEDMCFVPKWAKGFDNGTVDRVYIVDLDRTTESSGLIHVIDASTLDYITSFATNTFEPSSIIGDWWSGADHVWFSPERGEFAIESVAAVEGSTVRNNCLAIYDINGNYLRATKFQRTAGTEYGGDCDENYIYLGRYASGSGEGEILQWLYMLDWDLNLCRVVKIDRAAWEIEGVCHIGKDLYISYIEDETAKGASIYNYKALSDFHPYNQSFPVLTPYGWSPTTGFPRNSFVKVQ